MEDKNKNLKRKELEKRIKADYARVGKEILDKTKKEKKQDKDYEKQSLFFWPKSLTKKHIKFIIRNGKNIIKSNKVGKNKKWR